MTCVRPCVCRKAFQEPSAGSSPVQRALLEAETGCSLAEWAWISEDGGRATTCMTWGMLHCHACATALSALMRPHTWAQLQAISEACSLTCHDHEPSLGTGQEQDRSAVPRARSPPALRHSVDASASLCASSTDTRGLRHTAQLLNTGLSRAPA